MGIPQTLTPIFKVIHSAPIICFVVNKVLLPTAYRNKIEIRLHLKDVKSMLSAFNEVFIDGGYRWVKQFGGTLGH